MHGADLHTEYRCFTAKSHGTDAQLIQVLVKLLFQFGQLRIGIHIRQFAEELGFGG